jgi:phage terminase Nu1 subunit (DNA packaging protein)
LLKESTLVKGTYVAAVFKVTLRTVQNWKNAEGMPIAGRDKYDLAEVVRWRIERELQDRMPGSSDEARLIKAQADEREQKAKLVKMAAKKRAGELLEVEEVERGLIDRIIATKTALRCLSLVLVTRLDGVEKRTEIERIVETEVYSCMERFANADEQANAGKKFAKRLAEFMVKKLNKVPAKKVAAKIKKELGSEPWMVM